LDPLTHLINLAQPKVILDLRCRLAGSFVIDHGQSDARISPFHIILKGSCVIEPVRGSTIQATAGDFILFPRGDEHRITDVKRDKPEKSKIIMNHDDDLPLRKNCEGEPDVNILCGRFDLSQGPSELLFQSLPDPLHVSLANQASSPALQTLVDLMRDEAEHLEPGSLAIITALSNVLFVMALRAHGEQRSDSANILSLLADARMGPSVKAIIADPARPWTIEALGQIAAMSRATYARQFHIKAGVTVGIFLARIRMMIACGLLKNTKRNAADIGMQVGYQSEAAFGKAFRQCVGITPGRYRRHLI
jgi:AraC family transcriptional activator of mtrCDE